MWWSCLPKIEECRPRPSPLWTSDWTRGPLGVFVRQMASSLRTFLSFLHSDMETSERAVERAVSTAILLLCTVYSKFCFVCYSVFHICCLNLDFVVVHSDFAWLGLVF